MLVMPKRKNIKRYIQAPHSRVPDSRKVEGPGVWVTCIKGKEKQAVGEVYDIFESIAERLYPTSNAAEASDGDDIVDSEDIEAAMAKDLAELKKPRSKGSRFVNCKVDAICLVFMAVKPPIDPVRLILTYLTDVEQTGVTRTRSAQRYAPVSGSCVATIQDIVDLAKQLFPPHFESNPPRAVKYKIQVASRNHTGVAKVELIRALAACVPKDRGHTVDLHNPDLVILVELYAYVCGIGIVPDYYRFKKFNAVAIGQEFAKRHSEGEISRATS